MQGSEVSLDDCEENTTVFDRRLVERYLKFRVRVLF